MGDVSGLNVRRQGFWGKAVPVTLPWQRKVKSEVKSEAISARGCGEAVINCSWSSGCWQVVPAQVPGAGAAGDPRSSHGSNPGAAAPVPAEISPYLGAHARKGTDTKTLWLQSRSTQPR